MRKGFIKSPLNYYGNKYRLLPQIYPYIPKNIETFVDLFAGSFTFGVNIEAKKHIFNDYNYNIIEIFKALKEKTLEEIYSEINFYIEKYSLSKENRDSYLKARDEYNNNPDPILLYTLSCYSFNNVIRFNSNNEFNTSVGKSSFNYKHINNMQLFKERIDNMDWKVLSQDFRDVDISKLGPKDFVYLDPPYLITSAIYNEKRNLLGWNEEIEKDLYTFCEKLHKQKVRFAISNVVEHNGEVNNILKEFVKKEYITMVDLNYSYNLTKERGGKSREVLILNYKPDLPPKTLFDFKK